MYTEIKPSFSCSLRFTIVPSCSLSFTLSVTLTEVYSGSLMLTEAYFGSLMLTDVYASLSGSLNLTQILINAYQGLYKWFFHTH